MRQGILDRLVKYFQDMKASTLILSDIRKQQLHYMKCFFPMLAVAVPRNLNYFVSIYFAGRLNNDSVITGVGIGQMTLFCSLNSCVMGFNLLFEGYAGAIKSSSDQRKLGELLMKCFLQGAIVFLLALGPFLNLVHLISFLGDDEETHSVAKLFMRVTCLWPLLVHLQDLLVKYLVIQGFVKTPVVVGIAGLGINAALSYLCIEVLQWGVLGFGFTYTFTPLIIIAGTIVFCFLHREEMLWTGLSSDIWRGWPEMMRLGAFNSARLVSSNCLYILANIICQVEGPINAATVIIVDKINLLFNVFVYTGGSATAFIVGTALGRGDEAEVRRAILLGVVNWSIERASSLLIMFLTAGAIARLFTSTVTILSGVRDARLSMAGLYLLFGLDELLAQGILTPMGRQTLIGIVATLSIFLIGYPMMISMVYLTNTGAAGIFWCFGASYFAQSVAYVVRTVSLNIGEEISLCGERLARGFCYYGSGEEGGNKGDTELKEVVEFGPTDPLTGGKHSCDSFWREFGKVVAVIWGAMFVVVTISLSFL